MDQIFTYLFIYPRKQLILVQDISKVSFCFCNAMFNKL